MMPPKVLLCQSAGFIAIIGLSWLDECLGLRALVLGDHPYISDFRESTFEMLFVLAVWLLVFGATRRIMARVKHLEGFMRVCGWCHRIGTEGRWVRADEFLARKFDVHTTHGMCEECTAKQEALVDAEVARKNAAQPPANAAAPQAHPGAA
jgi:hypothetical protein